MKIPEKNVKNIERPDLDETFADSLTNFSLDGAIFRMEFCVTRVDKPNPPTPISGKRYPVCRLVMPADSMLDMFNKLQNFMNAMEQQGVIKKNPVPPTTTKQ